MNKRLACVALIIIVMFFLPVRAAQQVSSLTGLVVDQEGAPVVGAQVSLKTEKNILQSVTGADGSFSFADVRGARGTLLISASGFKKTEQAWNGQTTTMRVVLQPAGLAEQVTVSASRTETRLSETAASVLVLSSVDLEATPAFALDDVLKQASGFRLFRRTSSRAANPTAQGVSLRGVGASGASRAVVLADGIPLNDPFGGWVYWSRVPRESLERVEILRGGASDLYGSAALGGVINVVTEKPSENSQLSFETAYGNERTPDASLYASTRRGGWGAALAAEVFRTDGYILVDKPERGAVDTPANSKHTTLDLTLDRRFAENARVFLRGNLFGEVRANGTPLQNNRTHVRQLSTGGDWRSASLGAFLARAYLSAQIYDQDFSAVAANRNTESLTRSQRVPAQATGFTLQWSRAAGTRNAVVAGLDAQEIRGASDERVFANNRQTSLVGAGGRERIYGVFAQDVVRLTANLFLTIGARYDHWRNYNALSTTRPTAPGAKTTVSIFPERVETAFSPRAALLYRVNDKLSLSGSVYRAFRAPTLNELYRSFRVGDVLTLSNQDLQAERLTGGEAGAKISLGHQISLRGVGFWSDITRPIANVTLRTAPGLITRQRQNLGRTRSRGLEIEMSAPIGERWNISGGYALTDANVVEFPANKSLEGLWIPQVPRHQLSVQARYTNPAVINFSLQGRAVGGQFDDDQNRFRLNSFFTLDAFVSRNLTRQVELFAAAENLFNERYQVGRTPLVTLGSPLLARAGIRLRLGSK